MLRYLYSTSIIASDSEKNVLHVRKMVELYLLLV